MNTPDDEPQQESQWVKAERAWQEGVAKAFAVLEQNPDFPGALVRIHDRRQRAERNISAEAKKCLSAARLDHLLKVLDIYGEGFLRMVTDLASQKALATVMDDLFRKTWFQFSGIPLETIPPTSPFVETPHPYQSLRDQITKRAHFWVMKGYRRLAALSKREGAPTPSEVDLAPQARKSATRRAFTVPVLDKCEMTPNRWAAKAGIHPSMVYDYLAGKSNPRPQTRKLLADALHVNILDLPR